MNKLLILSLLLFFVASSVIATPGIPHQIYGSVTTNGHSAVDGLFIDAKIDGEIVESTVTSDGHYGLTPNIFYIRDPQDSANPIEPSREGKTVEIFVNDVKVTEFIFHNEESTQINLNVNGDFPALPSSSSSSSSSSSGGSSSSGSSSGGSSSGGDQINNVDSITINDDSGDIEILTSETDCVSDWICSEWADCINGVQKRVCVDANKCNLEDSKPEVRKDCPLPEAPKEKSSWNAITGFVSGNGGLASGIGLIIVLAVIAGLFIARKGLKK